MQFPCVSPTTRHHKWNTNWMRTLPCMISKYRCPCNMRWNLCALALIGRPSLPRSSRWLEVVARACPGAAECSTCACPRAAEGSKSAGRACPGAAECSKSATRARPRAAEYSKSANRVCPGAAECSTGASRVYPGTAECSTGAARATPEAQDARHVPLEPALEPQMVRNGRRILEKCKSSLPRSRRLLDG